MGRNYARRRDQDRCVRRARLSGGGLHALGHRIFAGAPGARMGEDEHDGLKYRSVSSVSSTRSSLLHPAATPLGSLTPAEAPLASNLHQRDQRSGHNTHNRKIDRTALRDAITRLSPG